jgi:hypothetical protein
VAGQWQRFTKHHDGGVVSFSPLQSESSRPRDGKTRRTGRTGRFGDGIEQDRLPQLRHVRAAKTKRGAV